MDKTTDHVRHHGHSFEFQARGLCQSGYYPEAGLDWLHCWLESQGPDQVAALHTALIETDGKDREGLRLPELEAVTRAEEEALFASVPEGHFIMAHQAIVVRAMREH